MQHKRLTVAPYPMSGRVHGVFFCLYFGRRLAGNPFR